MDNKSSKDQRIIDNAVAWARANKRQFVKRLTDKTHFLPDDVPSAWFMAGCPAAGKTEIARNFAALIGEEFSANQEPIMHIDADEIKEEMPGYTGENSRLFQFPASIIVDACYDQIMKNKQSFILDGTLSDLNKARQNIQRCLKPSHQYNVVIMFVYNNPIEAWKAATLRQVIHGRATPMDVFIDRYFKSKANVSALKKEFGAAIRVDLLFKPTNSKNGAKDIRPEFNVSANIDSYLPDDYNPETLKQALEKMGEL